MRELLEKYNIYIGARPNISFFICIFVYNSIEGIFECISIEDRFYYDGNSFLYCNILRRLQYKKEFLANL